MSEDGFSAIAELDTDARLLKALQIDNITEPSPVQELAIPAILAGKHTVLYSPTGTGKTLGYLLPILQKLRDPQNGRCVVMTPNPELAMQAYRITNQYKPQEITTAALTPGVTGRRQNERLTKNTRLVVGTAGRILELYSKKKMKNVTTLVLDEPDPILTSKGGDFLREILSRPEPKVQLIIATASLGPNTQSLIDEVMGTHYVMAKPEPTAVNLDIVHHYIGVQNDMGKDVCLARFIEENKCGKAIVFANQPNVIRHLYRYLNEHQLQTVTLSRDRNRDQRKQAITDITSGKAKVVITTDAAARGLDLRQIDWVLHYDLPNSANGYLHRAGRTGRAGRKGTSVAILTDRERARLKRFAKELGIDFSPFRRKN